MKNPYLDEFKQGPFEGFKGVLHRHDLVQKYAWAVPDENVIQELARLSPIVEIGAGSGYWAWLLRQAGADVVAFDETPINTEHHGNRHFKGLSESWTTVLHGGPEKAAEHSDRTLFLCWPPYDEPMAADCLRAYEGDLLCYIGEGEGGCTADDTFHEMLDRDWEVARQTAIPRWEGIYDSCRIYRRKQK